MKKTLILQSPAKINIGLWVKHRRPDRFHEIATLMQTISLADTIALRETREEGIRIECNHPDVPLGRENLAHRAACLLLERLGIAPHLCIQIDKKIPIAAGLAGGSSNAAGVLVGLVRLFDKSFPMGELMKLAALIGSDVPFLVKGGLAMATGRGEELKFYEPPRHPFPVIIAIPRNLQVETAWAYQNYVPGDNQRKEASFARLLDAYRDGDLETLRVHAFNDLESVTLQRFPQVQAIKEALSADRKGLVLMSGSGPSVLGIFPDQKSAVVAAARLDPASVDVFLEQTTRAIAR